MKGKYYIRQAQHFFEAYPHTQVNKLLFFSGGALWMEQQMKTMQVPVIHSQPSYYIKMGWFKYSVCIVFSLPGAVILYHLFPPLILFAPLFFYLTEIHFMFLFPMLIEGIKHPLYKSFKAVYQIGPLQCFTGVIYIAAFMVIGLFRKNNPLMHWYLGCMAILCWYKDEVRHRL